MHLPDGFLDAKTALLSTGAAAAGIAVALRQVRTTLPSRQMPVLGLTAAFVFAAQMLNFPVLGGTSGHLLGGVLTAVLLGPSAAVLVMSCVLIVQCLMFADGGLTALGANVFNMGVVAVFGGYLAFTLVRRLPLDPRRATVFAAAFAAWVGTVLASIGCAGQLALSGTAAWSLVFPAMVNIHMLIGLGEGLATGLIVLAVLRVRPELVAGFQAQTTPTRLEFVGYGLLLCVALAVFVAPFASPLPDGLERVARVLGFEEHARAAVFNSPLPDYQVPWLGSPAAATAIAGLVGTVIVFIAAYLLARMLVPALGVAKQDATRP